MRNPHCVRFVFCSTVFLSVNVFFFVSTLDRFNPKAEFPFLRQTCFSFVALCVPFCFGKAPPAAVCEKIEREDGRSGMNCFFALATVTTDIKREHGCRVRERRKKEEKQGTGISNCFVCVHDNRVLRRGRGHRGHRFFWVSFFFL